MRRRAVSGVEAAREAARDVGERFKNMGAAVGTYTAGSTLNAGATVFDALGTAYERSVDALRPVSDWVERNIQGYDPAAPVDPEQQRYYEELARKAAAQSGAWDVHEGAKGVQALADRLTGIGAEAQEKAEEGLSAPGKLLVRAGIAGGQMLGDAALGFGNAMVPMLARAFGASAQAARQKGCGVGKQVGLGLASAATEYFSERLFGGNPVYDADAGLVNRLAAKVSSNPTLLAYLSSVPAEIVSEGLEEVVSDVLEPIAERIIAGAPINWRIDALIEDAVIGMLLAGVGKVGSAAANAVKADRGETVAQNEQHTDLSSQPAPAQDVSERKETAAPVETAFTRSTEADQRTLFTYYDPMREKMGSACMSHSKEIAKIKRELIRKGITIKMRPGSMGYSPSLSKGNPGVLIMDPEASYSAWLHELKHIEDDEASGWSGFQLIQDIERFAALEDAAYAAEIDFARKNGYNGTARRLERLRFERRQEILGIQRNNKQPHE